jgi:hypothetical protein
MSDYYHQGGVSLVIYKKLINILMKRGEINVKSRNESNLRNITLTLKHYFITGYADAMMLRNESDFKHAPPTRAPSISG